MQAGGGWGGGGGGANCSACADSNNVSCLRARSDNSPLVVSPRARRGAGAAGIPAQFVVHVLPLSAHRDLGWWGGGGVKR